MNKIEDEAYNLIGDMVLNNYQWSNERSQPKRVGGKLELDAIFILSAKVDAMSQRLERLNVNSISSTTPSPSCEICRSIDHLIVNCQVGSPFALDVREPGNYVNNFNRRSTNDPFSSTYNPGGRSHPNFSYRFDGPLLPQLNFRPPPRFRRP